MKGLRHIKGKTASQLVGLLRKSGIKFDTNCPLDQNCLAILGFQSKRIMLEKY